MSDNIDETVEKSEDKKNIEMEEREQMLNAENKAQESQETPIIDDKKIINKENKEGMEVKPKKIPIGGIQMPGFFTRSKSKERCKDDDQEVEGAELIDNKSAKEETPIQPTRIKLPNPFRKSKLSDDNTTNATDNDKQQNETKERRTLLDTIRLPLVSVFPRKKKDSEQNLENQTAQAGLASMETLDDKSTTTENHDELKTVPLDDKKDVEKQDVVEEQTTWGQKCKTYRVAISAFLVFVLLLIIIIAIAIPGKQPPKTPPVKDGRFVETVTSCGKVEGLIEDSAVAFRGIPYARPPLGEGRFRRARPLNDIKYCWTGTYLAHNSTDTCLQIYSDGTLDGAENCLTLDVVTPYVRYDNPLPVIVLIGAESIMGGSPDKMRPSARYARSKDVVFVRPNFRLGALGFLSLDELSRSNYPRISGNYGLSDILEALKWVQLNIEHFGGDKRSVTLFGHRAGATLVTAIATIDKVNKYFTRAWASSGSAIYPKKPRQEAELENRSYLQMVDCDDIDCLLGKDAEILVTSVEDTWRKPQLDLPTPDENPDKRHEWLVLDGHILKEHPATVWAKEEELPVKLVIGTTAQSGASTKLLLKHKQWTEDLVKQHVNQSFLSTRNLTDEVLKMYPPTYKGLSSLISDIRIVCPLYAIKTQMHHVPFYVVTQTRDEQDIADIDSDIDAILGRYEPKTPEQRRYVSAMQNLFYHYVWHGKIEPSDETIGSKVLIVGQDVLPNSTYSHCAYWINKNIVLPYATLD